MFEKRQGYLLMKKKGLATHEWVRRYFVLDPYNLQWYESAEASYGRGKRIGILEMNGNCDVAPKRSQRVPYKLVLTAQCGPKLKVKTLQLACDSLDEMVQWQRSLQGQRTVEIGTPDHERTRKQIQNKQRGMSTEASVEEQGEQGEHGPDSDTERLSAVSDHSYGETSAADAAMHFSAAAQRAMDQEQEEEQEEGPVVPEYDDPPPPPPLGPPPHESDEEKEDEELPQPPPDSLGIAVEEATAPEHEVEAPLAQHAVTPPPPTPLEGGPPPPTPAPTTAPPLTPLDGEPLSPPPATASTHVEETQRSERRTAKNLKSSKGRVDPSNPDEYGQQQSWAMHSMEHRHDAVQMPGGGMKMTTKNMSARNSSNGGLFCGAFSCFSK